MGVLDNAEPFIEHTPSRSSGAQDLLKLDGTEVNAARAWLVALNRRTTGHVNVLEFIPPELHAGIKAGTSTTDVHAYIMAAINAQSYGAVPAISGSVYFPLGKYIVNDTIELKRMVRLFGDGAGYPDTPGPMLKFPAGKHGIVVNRYNTLAGAYEDPSTGKADGSIIEGLTLIGGGGATAHGVTMRARAVVRNVLTWGWSGDGMRVIAAAGSIEYEGNANGFRIEGGSSYYNGGNGLLVTGPDANAGYILGLDASHNSGWGIYDSSFLGNTYVACHTASNTLGSYKSDNENARNVFLGCYSESGQPPASLITPALVVGGIQAAGFTAESTHSGINNDGGAVSVGALHANRWLTGGIQRAVDVNLNHENGDVFSIYRSDVQNGMPWRLKWTNGTTGDLEWNLANSTKAMMLTGPDTAFAGGFGSVIIPKLYVGESGNGDGRRITIGSTAPSSGTWQRGDVIFNAAPSAGGKVGWVCTTAGTAGVDAVFKPFGAIDP